MDKTDTEAGTTRLMACRVALGWVVWLDVNLFKGGACVLRRARINSDTPTFLRAERL